MPIEYFGFMLLNGALNSQGGKKNREMQTLQHRERMEAEQQRNNIDFEIRWEQFRLADKQFKWSKEEDQRSREERKKRHEESIEHERKRIADTHSNAIQRDQWAITFSPNGWINRGNINLRQKPLQVMLLTEGAISNKRRTLELGIAEIFRNNLSSIHLYDGAQKSPYIGNWIAG